MKYIYVPQGVVQEVISEINPIFPGVSITERYSPDFLANCIALEESVEVASGWTYDKETGDLTPPPVPPEESEEDATPLEPGQPTLSERIAELEAKDLENKLAIAELAEAMLGGVS